MNYNDNIPAGSRYDSNAPWNSGIEARHCKRCGEPLEMDYDEDGHMVWVECECGDETYRYVCNNCGASESLEQYRSNYVCPWCGEGVMEREEP
jgi:DNA-directed RNA polymerase subunit RPC12/RpoP